MGRITEALKKVSDERIARIQKKPEIQYVVKKMENTGINEHIVSFHDPALPIGEQYKILRTNIQSLKSSNNYKTFLITSSINGEGKTVTSVNLAITMAHDLNNKSILLIDADMRKGKVARYLGFHSHPGLSDILSKDVALDSALVSPGIDNLSILLSGPVPKNPSELLNSRKMQSLMASFKEKFDYILIDSPPVMPLTDACILGPMTDAVILVVQAGRTQRGLVHHTESRLKQAGAKIIGAVMTNVEYHLPQYLYRYVHEYSEYK
ncbi:MAG: CpsD/CapB family tyrosine-protein kinase [Candidatus Omnitrophica bacterium]|nr:CpsD/CapB family tyrosine-protein kinase [Candidatus Omnitrophota bacterium]